MSPLKVNVKIGHINLRPQYHDLKRYILKIKMKRGFFFNLKPCLTCQYAYKCYKLHNIYGDPLRFEQNPPHTHIEFRYWWIWSDILTDISGFGNALLILCISNIHTWTYCMSIFSTSLTYICNKTKLTLISTRITTTKHENGHGILSTSGTLLQYDNCKVGRVLYKFHIRC